jgi:ribosomal protein L37AE/L43A
VTAPLAPVPVPECCGEQMTDLGAGIWECDPCGCLTAKDRAVSDRRCPDHS